ncbi:MAG: hypothetical protein ACRCVJ_18795 [Clostridium sp.]|uniref:hypothetical protein n=1 Tax=Clostridium sp. TaxID=1506 RepID=UPI003F39FB35
MRKGRITKGLLLGGVVLLLLAGMATVFSGQTRGKNPFGDKGSDVRMAGKNPFGIALPVINK